MTAQDDAITQLQTQVAALSAQVMALTAAHAASASATTIRGTGFVGSYPTDAMVQWMRRDDGTATAFGATTGVVSLVHEAQGEYSAAFPLMVQLRATDDPAANIATSESACSYFIVRNPGPGWAAGYHLDQFHTGGGITVGMNVEVKRTGKKGGTVIAVNAHNDTACSDEDADIAFNVQNPPGAGFRTAYNMEQMGVMLAALGRALLTVEADGSLVLGYDKAKITVRPDGNVGIDCGHLWFNGKMQF